MTRYTLARPGASLRAAIAINDIGCSLLERSCYAQAHETLKDAAYAMVQLLGSEGGEARVEESEETRSSLASKLVDADLRQAFPDPSMGTSQPLLPRNGSQKSPVPIRLTAFWEAASAPGEGAPAPDDLAVMSAIALHNTAVSCYYLSTDASRTLAQRGCLHSKAKILMRTSYRLLAELHEVSLPALHFGLAMLENLDAVLRTSPPLPLSTNGYEASRGGECSRPDDGETAAVEAELSRLREVVRALEGANLLFFGLPVGAAAA